LTRLYTTLKEVSPDGAQLDLSEPYAQRFADAMNDDFNTPIALATLFDLANEINRTKSAPLARQLKHLASVIGLLQRAPQDFFQGGMASASSDAGLGDMVKARIEARADAKRSKNFAEADRIRTELLAEGIVLEDKPGGVTEWRKV
jgi:cysteinyl-tRNA synthetase